MTLFNRLKRAKKTLGSLLLAGTLAVTGCSSGGGGGGGGGGDDDDDNHAPVITSTPGTEAIEDQPYTYDVNATDSDGDTVSYSFPEPGNIPAGMIINSSTGVVSWTPNDTQTAQSYTIKVEAWDGEDSDTQTYTLNAINTEDISGIIRDAETGNILPGITVHINGEQSVTDAAGQYAFNDVRDGDYPVIIKDPFDFYVTYKPGFFRVGKLEKKTADTYIYKNDLVDFLNDTIRHNGEIRKWKTEPKFRIYTIDVDTGLPIAPATVTAIRNAITTELNQYGNTAFTFDAGDIEEQAAMPPPGQIPGYVKIYWDSSMSGGANASWFAGNEITASFAKFDPAVGKPVHLQELTAALIGSGETTDATYSDSVFYDPPTANAFSTEDLITSRLLYQLDGQRPAGNKDLFDLGLSTDPDDKDVNPATYQWNQTHVAPAAQKLIPPAMIQYDTGDDGYSPDDDCFDDFLQEDLKQEYEAKPEQVPEVF